MNEAQQKMLTGLLKGLQKESETDQMMLLKVALMTHQTLYQEEKNPIGEQFMTELLTLVESMTIQEIKSHLNL